MTHFICTPAKITICPRCYAPVLSAHDEGMPVHVDITPLATPQDEINALINGHSTHTLTLGRQLIYRSAERIRHNTLNGTIHVAHHCTKKGNQK